MISGDWHPTPDPTGRQVRFTNLHGVEMQGTVVDVEYEEDHDPILYVDVTSPEQHRGQRGVCPSRITWLDVDQPSWTASESPTGRWVLFEDDDQVERSGCIVTVDSCHRQDAVLSVLVVDPGFFGVRTVDWRRARWLPE